MHKLIKLLGIQLDTTSHLEKLISMLGGFAAIFCILHITHYFIAPSNSLVIIASMGASAVLLFAVPHGPLSQPWPVFLGHALSAFIGVTCYKLIPDIFLAASIAVGVSILAMHYFRCIHPPGGATALAAVVSGPSVHEIGYQFVITPVLLNTAVIIGIAIIINYPFSWRRYPIALADIYKDEFTGKKPHPHIGLIPRRDLEFALKSMQSFADINEVELERIYKTATEYNRSKRLSSSDIILGHYYLHGQNNGNGVIRRVIDESEDNDVIIYKNITGPEKKSTGTKSREAFADWAKHEVIFSNNEWKIKSKQK